MLHLVAMARAFSTTARALLRFLWKGTDPVPKYESMIENSISQNPKLVEVDKIEIEYEVKCSLSRRVANGCRGREHKSRADPVDRVSGKLFKGETRVTSVHAYHDGRVVYSKEEFNEAQK